MHLDLKSLKIDKENSAVEAKRAGFSLPKSIWETYSAFANTDGGQILLGVTEDNETKELVISGITDPLKVKKEFWDTINNPQKVSYNILSEKDFDEITFPDGRTIFIIHVPRAKLELRPIYINDEIVRGSYKRNHEGDYRMTREDVSKMLRDAYPYSYDLKVYDDLPLSILSDETIDKYRRYDEGHKNNHPWSKLSNEQYLLMIGAAAFSDSDWAAHPTMAGLLMFGKEHTITQILPDYSLDYSENLDPGKVRWTDRVQSISGEWSGNLFDFYLKVNNKLVSDFKVPFKLRGMERIDDTLLHNAVREAFVNCLSNADYFGRSGIVIKKNIDSIVFENPGSIRVGKEQMMRGGISDARNKTIMKMFNLLGYGEKDGSGIPLIIQATKEFGLTTPEVSEDPEFDRTIFTIYLTKPAVQGNKIEDIPNGAEIKPNGAEIKPNGAEIESNGAEIESNGAKTEPDNAKAEFRGAENKPNNAEVKSNNAEVKSNNAEVKSNNAEIKSDNAEIKSDNAEIKSDNAKIKSDNAEIKSDNAETESNGAKTKSDTNAEPIKSRKNSQNKKHKKQYSINLILETLKECSEMSAREISPSINLSLRRTRELLSELVRSGMVITYGSNEKKKYILP